MISDNEMKGGKTLNVMEIERFSIHDGPGIRTTVFLKGCPLHCPWCANPESQSPAKQLMYFENKCVRCQACKNVCKTGALSFKPDGRPVFSREICNACGECARACPQSAISFSGEIMPVGDVLSEVLLDRDYYQETGGGLTVSGGEPFVQLEGLLALLGAAKAAGLHTVIETTGNVAPDRFMRAFAYTDLFLFDLKHTDADVLKDAAGADLETILGNLSRAARNDCGVILRTPVIPGFNCCNEVLDSIFAIALDNQIAEVHLLPYHVLGKNKYAQLGLRYPYPHTTALDKEELLPFKKHGEALGLKVEL